MWYITLRTDFRFGWITIGKSESKLKYKRTCDDNNKMEHKWEKKMR